MVSGDCNITITTIPTTKRNLYACPKRERVQKIRHQNKVYTILVRFSSVYLTHRNPIGTLKYLGLSNIITRPQKKPVTEPK